MVLQLLYDSLARGSALVRCCRLLPGPRATLCQGSVSATEGSPLATQILARCRSIAKVRKATAYAVDRSPDDLVPTCGIICDLAKARLRSLKEEHSFFPRRLDWEVFQSSIDLARGFQQCWSPPFLLIAFSSPSINALRGDSVEPG